MVEVNRLNARQVATLRSPGRYADGAGLYLRVTPKQRVWSFLFRWDGRQAEISLGNPDRVSLAEARRKAEAARRAVADGVHPGANKKKPEAKAVPTFAEAATAYIEAHESSWRNAKHRDQWRSTLSVVKDDAGAWVATGHCEGIRATPISDITVDDVVGVLKPIWLLKAETASRLRGRIESILDAAIVNGQHAGPNPARWKGHLEHLLPKRQRLQKGHHAAMAFEDVPAFIKRLRGSDTIGAAALEFAILTAARSGEVRGAAWAEINLANKTWTIPPARMKMKREHVVPLTDRAVAILEKMALVRTDGDAHALVFPGRRRGSPLSDMALTALLRRWKIDATAHGFRSAFRDWAGDQTDWPREIIEHALAHAAGDKTEVAYRRRSAVEKRRGLMNEWSVFIEPAPDSEADTSNVVAIRKSQ